MNKKTKRIFSGASSALMIASGAAQTALAETAYNVIAGESAAEYDKVANAEGRFSFNQNKLTPPDEVFNLFGTAVTGVCARPDFALSSTKTDYYINVGGKIGLARAGEHLCVAIYMGVGVLNLNEMCVGLAHRSLASDE